MTRWLLPVLLLLAPLAAQAQAQAPEPPQAAPVRADGMTEAREAQRLRRSLEALREASVLMRPQMPDVPIPSDAPAFTTRAGCAAALGMAAVGAPGTLVCRARVDRFPFLGADPTPERLPVHPLHPDADRG
jgi:hypothetical protein